MAQQNSNFKDNISLKKLEVNIFLLKYLNIYNKIENLILYVIIKN